MRIIVKGNYKELSKEAALFVKKRILKKPNIVLALPTGSTVLGMYKELVKMHRHQALDFSQVTTFNLDEYVGLNAEHPQSYHFYMQQNFFQYINIKRENIFIPDGTAQKPLAYSQWYEEKIKEKGGLDLSILGIGRNGHIGFNEPGSSFDSRTRLITLAQETLQDNSRFFKNIDEVPKKAITMGIKTIMEAKECLLLASGAKKSEIVYKALKGRISSRVPASFLQKHHNFTVILDKEAASKL